MNVLLLDQYSDPGGAQQVLLELLPAMRRRSWRVVAGLPGSGSLFDTMSALGVPAEHIDCGPYHSARKSPADMARFLAQTPRLAEQIRALAQHHQADLVYVNGPRIVPAAALSRLDCPMMFHSHSWIRPGAVRTATGLALRKSRARVVANCDFVARTWRRFVAPESISIVENGVAGPTAPPRQRMGGPPRVGCIGRIGPEKGQREFLDAAARIHEALPQCRFVVCGDALFGNATSERYAAEIRSAAAGLPVEFCGWVSDIYSVLADLDLLLVPSIGPEATTRVILEAFAAGVPVIAFETGGISEVVKTDVTGVLVRSAKEMAGAALALLTGAPERRDAMARAARIEWERRFRLSRFQESMLGLMNELTSHEPVAASAIRC